MLYKAVFEPWKLLFFLIKRKKGFRFLHRKPRNFKGFMRLQSNPWLLACFFYSNCTSNCCTNHGVVARIYCIPNISYITPEYTLIYSILFVFSTLVDGMWTRICPQLLYYKIFLNIKKIRLLTDWKTRFNAVFFYGKTVTVRRNAKKF